MVSLEPLLPLVDDEIAYLGQVHAFMLRKFEIDDRVIGELQELLSEAPRMPEEWYSWSHSMKELVEGIRNEVRVRLTRRESVAKQLDACRDAITALEHDKARLDSETAKLASTDELQAAEQDATLYYNAWQYHCSPRSDDTPRRLRRPLTRGNSYQLSDTKEDDLVVTLRRYQKQDLRLRHLVWRTNESRHEFVWHIPNRIKHHYELYRPTLNALKEAFTAFGNYACDIAGALNGIGSTLWRSSQSIEPLVDSNRYRDILSKEHQTQPFRFAEATYRNAGSTQPAGTTQAILFGKPMRSSYQDRRGGATPISEFLLDGKVDPFNFQPMDSFETLSYWSNVNLIEEEWKGVEGYDRLLIQSSRFGGPDLYLNIYLQCLPEPLLRFDNALQMTVYGEQASADAKISAMWDTWSADPFVKSIIVSLFSRIRAEHHDLAHYPMPVSTLQGLKWVVNLLARREDKVAIELVSGLILTAPWEES